MTESIRPMTPQEQGKAAAAEAMKTGEPQANPFAGTEHAEEWRSAFEVELLLLSSRQGAQGVSA